MTEARLTPLKPGAWRLSGVLDFSTVPCLAREGETLIGATQAQGLRRLEIDLSGVELTNSAGLALLLEWMRLAQARDIRLTYRHLPDPLARIAAFSNLQGLLPTGV